MVATVAGIHLGIDTHANRPAANTAPDGSFYSCSTHGLIYKSNYAGNSWATWATLGGAAANLAAASYVRTAGDYSTASASWVDVDATNMALVLVTGARRVVVGFTGSVYNGNATGYVVLGVSVDGTMIGDATYGTLVIAQHPTASDSMNGSFTILTPALTAASHTIKLRYFALTAGTATISGVQPACEFFAYETYAA